MMKNSSKAQKIALSGILTAVAVIFGTFSIPIGIAKISPVQHFINVVSAVVLGPVYAVLNAFIASLIRNIMGTGSLLAFPGSMIGALISGIVYKYSKKIYLSAIGEVIGTGLIGAIVAYPVAKFLMGKSGAVIMFVFPFMSSCAVGALIAFLFLNVPVIKQFLKKFEGEV